MTISSKLYTSRIVVSGGGGGLILDLTPDFWVTLEKKEVRDRAQHQKNVQSHKTIQVSTALVFFMFSGSIKPLQSYSTIFIRWPHKTCFENDNERTRESFDIVFVAQGLSDTISVDFCDYNLVLCVWECICKLLIYRRQVLNEISWVCETCSSSVMLTLQCPLSRIQNVRCILDLWTHVAHHHGAKLEIEISISAWQRHSPQIRRTIRPKQVFLDQ